MIGDSEPYAVILSEAKDLALGGPWKKDQGEILRFAQNDTNVTVLP
jgi:hypothetical protein